MARYGRLDGHLDGVPLVKVGASPLLIHRGAPVPDEDVEVTPRIGITQAADWPLRFLVRGSEHVSATPKGFFRRKFEVGERGLETGDGG